MSALQAGHIILSLGAEMGSITLRGGKEDDRWHFILAVDDYSAADLLDEESVHQLLPASSLEEAIQYLDRYRWHRLHPVVVHAEFRAALWSAVKDRCAQWNEQPEVLDRWRRVCGVD